jgi:branched-chain amino acid transport system substrate-binding protein
MRTFFNRKGITRIQATIIAIIIIVAVIAAVAVVYMTPPPPARDYYNIGVVTELTGDLARGGFTTKRGYDLWADTINKKGGITIDGKSYSVRLTYYDAKSDPAEAAKAVEKAVADGVDFLLGPYSSMCTLGAGPICEQKKMPMVTGSAESHLIPKEHYSYTFQFLVTTGETPEIPITCLVEQYKLPIKTVAVIGADDAFSKSLAESFRDTCTKHGLEVVFFEIYPVAITDLSPVITKIMAKNPDVFINAGHPSNHVIAVRNSKELGFNPKVLIVHWGVTTADFIDELKADSNYVVGVDMWSPKNPWKDPLFGSPQGFADEFEKVYGRLPDYTEAGCAATGVFVGELLKKYKLTPPFDDEKRAAFRDALEEFSVENFMGATKFSTDPAHWHVNIGLVEYLLAVQIVNEKPVIIGPEKAKEANIVFPKPPW